ncbi:MAG TPA: DUF262 domain-containing protein [Allosphingosinicella sp.]
MDAKDYIVNEVLRDPRRFMVPIYQRQYQWGPKRLIPLWEDIVAKADEVLAGESRFMHYMGALILAPTGDANKFAITPSIQVVDGQQRLTSFELFLAAVREKARELNVPDVDAGVADYIFNTTKSQDTDPNAKFKLTPTPADRRLFWTIIEEGREGAKALMPNAFYKNGGLKAGAAPAALAAYEFFLQKIDLYARLGVSDQALFDGEETDQGLAVERVGALINAVLSRMKLVVIELGEADDAQVIFETLNSQAEPLLAMDLVRNNIFHRAERQGASVETLHAELWQPFETPFWKEPAPRARPVRPRIEHFLAHALTAQTGAATSMRELYAEYRAFARPKGRERFESVADELKALTQFVPVYKELEGQAKDDLSLSWIGSKLAHWEVTTAYPVIFRIAVSDTDVETRRAMFEIVYSYIVRRGLCLLGAKNLNNVFQRVVSIFLRDGVTPAVLAGALLDQTGTAGRFPTDEEFRSAIVGTPIYGRLNNPRLGDVLWELELLSRSSKMEEARPPNLWVEHVMPYSWSAHWPLPDGTNLPTYSSDPDVVSLISRRERLIHTLGNLTLVTSGLNISMGNDSFVEKREELKAHTLLVLNQWILARNGWTEDDIEARSAFFADLALARWPRPVSG